MCDRRPPWRSLRRSPNPLWERQGQGCKMHAPTFCDTAHIDINLATADSRM